MAALDPALAALDPALAVLNPLLAVLDPVVVQVAVPVVPTSKQLPPLFHAPEPQPMLSFASLGGSHLDSIDEELNKRLAVGSSVHMGWDLGRGRGMVHSAVHRRASSSMIITDPSKMNARMLSSMGGTPSLRYPNTGSNDDTSLGCLNPGSNDTTNASADGEAGADFRSWPDSPGRMQQKQLSRRLTAMLDRALSSSSGPQNHPPSYNESGSTASVAGGQLLGRGLSADADADADSAPVSVLEGPSIATAVDAATAVVHRMPAGCMQPGPAGQGSSARQAVLVEVVASLQFDATTQQQVGVWQSRATAQATMSSRV